MQVELRDRRRQYAWALKLVFGVTGWAYCGAIIGIGRQLLPMNTVLWLHVIGAPLGFALLSYLYFRKFPFARPLKTAVAFTAIVAVLDIFIVAPVFERSFAMFESPLGTWLPLIGIFAASLLAGAIMTRRSPEFSPN